MELSLENASLRTLLTLPSGGDTSYPGLVWHGGTLWMSYYSSHEGKTSVYVAEIGLARRTLNAPRRAGRDPMSFWQRPGASLAAGCGLCLALALLLAASRAPAPTPGERQESGSTPRYRIGALFWHRSPNDFAALDGFRAGLAAWGEVELEVAHAEEDQDRAREILAAFAAKPVDLILALGTRAALLAAEAAGSIPVVFTAVTNPVESGVVAGWEGSGRRVAGNSNWIASDTLVEVFRLAVPDLERLGMLRSSGAGVVSGAELRQLRRHLGGLEAPPFSLCEQVVDDEEELGEAVTRLLAADVQAIWIPIDFLVYENLDRVLDALGDRRIPLVSSSVKGTRAGAVAGVFVDYGMLGRNAAALTRRILEDGADPGSLPVGTMEGYRVEVNLAAARRCGYPLPLSLLVLADSILDDRPEEGSKDER